MTQRASKNYTIALVVLLTTWLSLSAQTSQSAARSVAKMAVRDVYGNLPIRFESEDDSAVRFQARGMGYRLSLTATEAMMEFPETEKAPSRQKVAKPHALRMRLSGANRDARINGLERLSGRSNYFLGADSKHWRTDVPGYAKVRCENVYPGIDLVYYGNQRQLEYDFVVSPEADPQVISWQFIGARSLKLDAGGNLLIGTSSGELRQHKPFAYQRVGGQKREIASRFVLDGQTVRFALGVYDKHAPLVIDPVLSYATLLGGALEDIPQAVSVDAQGNVYVTGWTYHRDQRGTGADFPTTAGAVRSNKTPPVDDGTYAFVTKLNPAGTALIYSAIGGFTLPPNSATVQIPARRLRPLRQRQRLLRHSIPSLAVCWITPAGRWLAFPFR